MRIPASRIIFRDWTHMNIQALAHNADNSRRTAGMRVPEECGFLRVAVHRNAITKMGETPDDAVYAIFR